MANFGLDDLRIVDPRDGWPNAEAQTYASGANWVIKGAEVFDTLEQAVGDLNHLYATTARPRDMVKPVATPHAWAGDAHERVAAGQRIGVLFGPERTGLENDEVALANAIIMAPVNPRFASINLAQAVLLVGYEWRRQADDKRIGRHTDFDGLEAGDVPQRRSRPATRAELVGLYEHLESELDKSGFLRPPEKRPQDGPKSAQSFGPYGTNRAGSPDPAWHCGIPEPETPPRPGGALVMPSFTLALRRSGDSVAGTI